MDQPAPTPPGSVHRNRRLFAAGALGAALVTLVFATVGDGVDVEAESWRGVLVDHGHTAVWVLLTAAFGAAAVTGTWRRASSVLASSALALYVLFLAAVLPGS